MQHLGCLGRRAIPLATPLVGVALSLIFACRSDSGSQPAPESTSNAASAAPATAAAASTEAATPTAPDPAASAANSGPSSSATAPSSTEPSSGPTVLAPAPVPSSSAGAGANTSGGTAGNSAAPAPPATPTPPTPPEAPAPSGPFTVFLAGDSTVQTYVDTASDRDQAGWGQMLAPHFISGDVTVDNRAIGGRTARRFIDEGHLDEILAALLPGDYLLVQFGTNDGNRTATYDLGGQAIPYYLDPATDFKSYLQQYLDGARGHGATPVLVTPPPRNSAYCTGGNGTGAHAQAMRELGQAEGVSVVDLNAASVAYLMAICPAPTPEDFFLLHDDGTIDGTHFQENGARILAGFVASGLRAVEPRLAPLLDR